MNDEQKVRALHKRARKLAKTIAQLEQSLDNDDGYNRVHIHLEEAARSATETADDLNDVVFWITGKYDPE